MTRLFIFLGLGLTAAALAAGRDEPIQPLPSVKLDTAIIELGRRLFHDPRLSSDDTVSCASCHNLERGGVDGLAVSKGVGGAAGVVNAPTVLNSGFNFRQFWDGRAASLEEQIEGPVHARFELNSSWPQIIAKLSQDQGYQRDFAALYPNGLNADTIKGAIATFQRSLVTPSRFDDYLRGDRSALSADEQQGYKLFKAYGCIACHQGVNIGGNMYQYFGVMDDYFKDRGQITRADYGRYNVTGQEHDRFKFKVPSLRNVALTAPYFHDGSADTLEEAVAVMAKYQLGRPLPERDRALIVKFLHTLTGQSRGEQS